MGHLKRHWEEFLAQQALGDVQVATSLPYAVLVKGREADGGPDVDLPLIRVGFEEPGSDMEVLMMTVDALLGKWFPSIGHVGDGCVPGGGDAGANSGPSEGEVVELFDVAEEERLMNMYVGDEGV